ncbi:putative nucleotidyltransferase substrate binding domain-containing protein [Chitinibacter sp. GC72]|uniref:putative nucleotidyltransferase substrate binding domain-containing protein n=1 Tax=Chitinibacter sp. GC72 TaxID=1526917 RepID=UPI0012FA1479|nr:putative nucleotidyltransferase substrate binding domain-containing protein [Chitinibacter sp. GC72]
MEITEVSQFLAANAPFTALPASQISQIAKQLTVVYYRAQESIPSNQRRLMMVRTGVFGLYDEKNKLITQLQAGDFYGYQTLLTDLSNKEHLHCEEDALVYWFSSDAFDHLRHQHKNIEIFFQRLFSRSLHQYKDELAQSRFTLKICDVVKNRKIALTPEHCAQDAAILMTQHRVSSLIIEKDGALVGIVTDRDLRSRVLAQNLPASSRLCQIMTPDPHTIDKNSYLFEAVQMMSRFNIHHLPVTEHGHSYGMISTTDVVRAQHDHPVYLISEIHRQQTLDELAQFSQKIQALICTLGKQQVPAHDAGQIISTITDALTQKLIKLAQQTLGPAPFTFTWLAFGSQARMDQSINADQDNALLLEQEPDEQAAVYFENLANFVCHGLSRCGIPLCPGNIMASNSELRLSAQAWTNRFFAWIETPTPKALLNASIYFDLRPIEGNKELFTKLQNNIQSKSAGNDLFFAHLARTALENTAPIGFLKGFILEEDGNHNKGLDLKKRGISLITDLARVYALATGVSSVNTRQRLQELTNEQHLDPKDGQTLLDAFDILAQLRWDKHLQDLAASREINNLLDPSTLSSLQRHQLKDCFAVISNAQSSMRYRFCREM